MRLGHPGRRPRGRVGTVEASGVRPRRNVRGASQKRGRGIDLVAEGDPELVDPQGVERLETVGSRQEDRGRDERAGAERYELRRIAESDDERPDLRMQRAVQLTERDRPHRPHSYEQQRREESTSIAFRIFRPPYSGRPDATKGAHTIAPSCLPHTTSELPFRHSCRIMHSS